MSYTPLDESGNRRTNNRTTAYHESNEDDQFRVSPTSASGPQQQHDLAEPLADPFYVLRDDLARKLDYVDEALAEYLRVVHHTVRYK